MLEENLSRASPNPNSHIRKQFDQAASSEIKINQSQSQQNSLIPSVSKQLQAINIMQSSNQLSGRKGEDEEDLRRRISALEKSLQEQEQKNLLQTKQLQEKVEQLSKQVNTEKQQRNAEELAKLDKMKQYEDLKAKYDHLHFYLQRNAQQFQSVEEKLKNKLEQKNQELNELNRNSMSSSRGTMTNLAGENESLKKSMQELAFKLTEQERESTLKEAYQEQQIQILTDQLQQCQKQLESKKESEGIKQKYEEILDEISLKDKQIKEQSYQMDTYLQELELKNQEIKSIEQKNQDRITQLESLNNQQQATIQDLSSQLEESGKKKATNNDFNVDDKMQLLQDKNKQLTYAVVELETRLGKYKEKPAKLGSISFHQNNVALSSDSHRGQTNYSPWLSQSQNFSPPIFQSYTPKKQIFQSNQGFISTQYQSQKHSPFSPVQTRSNN